ATALAARAPGLIVDPAPARSASATNRPMRNATTSSPGLIASGPPRTTIAAPPAAATSAAHAIPRAGAAGSGASAGPGPGSAKRAPGGRSRTVRFGRSPGSRGLATGRSYGSLAAVPHPSRGCAPQDLAAGFPAAAERLRAARSRLGARALEVALEQDPSIATRHGELGLRKLLRDTEPLIDRLA